MKKFVQKVDLFCYRHPNFGIPRLMLYIVIGNAAVWLFGMMDTTGTFYSYLYFSAGDILRGQVWRLLSFALIPNSSGLWIIIALYFYYFIGSTLENAWGPGKFTLYFFCGLIFNIIYGFLIFFITGRSMYIGSTYIYLSMFFSFATMYPEQRVLLFFFIPIKMKWLAWFDAALFLVAVVTTPFPARLLPIVAVLNYLLFCGGWLIDSIRPEGRADRKRTINFKSEVRRINYEQAHKPYSRKCEVCGRTDADNPELEFRYCSRCEGYHCFCADHINSHIHFKQ